MGHEAIGVVEAVGADVRKIKKGDFVVMPFAYSDGTCDLCHEGLQTACVHGGFFGFSDDVGGAQAEAIRVPLADGTTILESDPDARGAAQPVLLGQPGRAIVAYGWPPLTGDPAWQPIDGTGYFFRRLP